MRVLLFRLRNVKKRKIVDVSFHISGRRHVTKKKSTSNHNCPSLIRHQGEVVLYLVSTSNHNSLHGLRRMPWLFYILFLHQTTTPSAPPGYRAGCFISCFYIKPQLECHSRYCDGVVLYLVSTSNHNRTWKT